MSGITTCAIGNVAEAAETIFLVSFVSCALLLRVLSLIPKDNTAILTISEVGVLVFRICAAWFIVAPGYESTWILLSHNFGSLQRFESPMKRIWRLGVRVQFPHLFPPCSCLVKSEVGVLGVVVTSACVDFGCEGCGGSVLGFGFSDGICVVCDCSRTTVCRGEEANSSCFLASWITFACM